MQPIRSVMVGLDLTPMDDILIRYAAFLTHQFSDLNHVLFVHNIKFDYPDEANEVMENLDRPLPEVIEHILKEKIANAFEEHSPQPSFTIEVVENHATGQELARIAKQHDVDLTVIGKKLSYKGSGFVGNRFLAVPDLPTDILMVPETAYYQMNNPLIPVDFSQGSTKAIKRSAELFDYREDHMHCLHVMNVPARYFPFLPVEQVKEKIRNTAQKDWRKYIEKLAVAGNINCDFIFTEGTTIASSIYDYAMQEQHDLLVVGAKGRGRISDILVGSVALRLARLNLHMPLLIVR